MAEVVVRDWKTALEQTDDELRAALYNTKARRCTFDHLEAALELARRGRRDVLEEVVQAGSDRLGANAARYALRETARKDR